MHAHVAHINVRMNNELHPHYCADIYIYIHRQIHLYTHLHACRIQTPRRQYYDNEHVIKLTQYYTRASHARHRDIDIAHRINVRMNSANGVMVCKVFRSSPKNAEPPAPPKHHM